MRDKEPSAEIVALKQKSELDFRQTKVTAVAGDVAEPETSAKVYILLRF